jgi:hypothetical protein
MALSEEYLREEYIDGLKFEHELINRRVTWLLTSQSILFVAYGMVLDKLTDKGKPFLQAIAMIGPLISIFILVSIIAAMLAKYLLCRKYRKDSNKKEEPFGVSIWTTWLGFVPDIALPLVFIFAWCNLHPWFIC